MKKTPYLFLSILLLMMFSSCDDESKVMAGYQDGEELEEGDRVPFLLDQNYPNPFNVVTEISYQVAVSMPLTLKVYTDDWQEVITLVDKYHKNNHYKVIFEGKNYKGESVPSGEYFYTLEGDGIILIRKMKVLK